MRFHRAPLAASLALAMTAACSSNDGSGQAGSGGHAASGAGGQGATASGGGGGAGGAKGCGGAPASGVGHVVIIVQENHTFDTYFGDWCKATPGSNPTCTKGPTCCEAAPAQEPSGAAPVTLDDAANGSYDPNHGQSCEVGEIDGGKMDKFVTGTSCSDPRNFAIAPSSIVKPYQDLASQYAIADRYFQPVAGASSSNDMYLAVADYVFIDNKFEPDADGKQCSLNKDVMSFKGTTIADLLEKAGKTVAWYGEGYAALQAAGKKCPSAPPECALKVPIYPCVYDPSDVPFLYYPQLADDPSFVRDFGDLDKDLAGGTLPDVAYVKGLGFHTEHPGVKAGITEGVDFVTSVIQAIEDSCYKDDTLVLLTWDEGGGYFDHVAPPADSAVDMQPYGTRLPLLAIGRYAKKGVVSHVTMEHSSIVKFLEFNYLGGKTGQLGARDAVVNNIGSLLDPEETGVTIPDQ